MAVELRDIMADLVKIIKQIEELLNLAQTQAENFDSYGLDNTKRKAIVLFDNSLGNNNSYSKELFSLDFMSIGHNTYIYGPDIRRTGAKLINILDEFLFAANNDVLYFSEEMTRDLKLPSARKGISASSTKTESNSKSKVISEKIFIVHGHSDEMKESVARLIEKIGLTPIILHEQPSKGSTIIKKLECHSDVSFAIVLISPDDLVLSGSSGEEKYRPRQNVIFEMGYFIGKLGTECVFSLCKGPEQLDFFSDYQGVIYSEYDSSGKWKMDLIRELKACKYDIDSNRII